MMTALLKERLRMRLLKITGADFIGRNVRSKLPASRMVYHRRIADPACPHGPAASRLGGDGTHFLASRSILYCGSAIALTHADRTRSKDGELVSARGRVGRPKGDELRHDAHLPARTMQNAMYHPP
jgi:hypothetical protein